MAALQIWPCSICRFSATRRLRTRQGALRHYPRRSGVGGPVNGFTAPSLVPFFTGLFFPFILFSPFVKIALVGLDARIDCTLRANFTSPPAPPRAAKIKALTPSRSPSTSAPNSLHPLIISTPVGFFSAASPTAPSTPPTAEDPLRLLQLAQIHILVVPTEEVSSGPLSAILRQRDAFALRGIILVTVLKFFFDKVTDLDPKFGGYRDVSAIE